jgi:sulfite exporter TauE/SafE
VTAFAAGLLMGFGSSLHCAAMCGPLVIWATGIAGTPDAGWLSVLGRSAWHHAGRVGMYASLGLAVGFSGELLADAGMRQVLAIAVGTSLVTGGVLTWRGSRWQAPGSRWQSRAVAWAGRMRRDRWWGRAALGLMNGLLPCGVLYGAILAASGFGSALMGLGFMTAFGLGTVPALATISLSAASRPAWRTALRQASPAATVLVGLLLIARGFDLPVGRHHLPGGAAHTHHSARPPLNGASLTALQVIWRASLTFLRSRHHSSIRPTT